MDTMESYEAFTIECMVMLQEAQQIQLNWHEDKARATFLEGNEVLLSAETDVSEDAALAAATLENIVREADTVVVDIESAIVEAESFSFENRFFAMQNEAQAKRLERLLFARFFTWHRLQVLDDLLEQGWKNIKTALAKIRRCTFGFDGENSVLGALRFHPLFGDATKSDSGLSTKLLPGARALAKACLKANNDDFFAGLALSWGFPLLQADAISKKTLLTHCLQRDSNIECLELICAFPGSERLFTCDALMQCFYDTHFKSFETLLACPKFDINTANAFSTLFSMCSLHELEYLRLLLQRPDIDVNKQTPWSEKSWSPLAACVSNDNVEALLCTEELLKHPRLDLSATNAKKINALHVAVLTRGLAVAPLLRAASLKSRNDFCAFVNAKDEKGKTPLILAAFLNDKEMFGSSRNAAATLDALLLCDVINVNEVDDNQNCALSFAAQCYNKFAVFRLLQRPDILVNLPNRAGLTPFMHLLCCSIITAKELQICEIIRMFASHPQFRIDAVCNAKCTALMYAAQHCTSAKVIQCLLEIPGARELLNKTDSSGKTAWDMVKTKKGQKKDPAFCAFFSF